MRLTVKVSDSVKNIIDGETLLISTAVRRGMQSAGAEVQQQLRDNVQAGGFASGADKIAKAWRLKVYPLNGGFTLRPSALISTAAPNIIDAFEQGVPIKATGGKYLCWPTPFNAAGGRRSAGSRGGVRVTPQDMVASKKEAAVIGTKRKDLKLWCLRVREGYGRTRSGRFNKKRIRLYVGHKSIEILTGRIKASERNRRVEDLLNRGYVAMFFLAKQVAERKRLDVSGIFAKADDVLETSMQAALT